MVRLELSDGMWAMGKIESIAVAHLNKRNALSWAQYKSLFPVLAHYAAPPDPLNMATDDPNRALNQTVGQGHIMQFAAGDRFEYTSPDSSPYSVAAADLNNLRDEMHRVVHQMALSVDNSAAALGRSAESKQVDQSAAAVVLRDLAKTVREHAVELHEVLQVIRADPKSVEWSTKGMDRYDDATVDNVVTQAQNLEIVSIPSASFQRAFKFQLARRVLGDSASPELLEDIEADLEANISNEQFTAPVAMAMVAGAAAGPDASTGKDLEDDEVPDEPAPPPPKPAPTPAVKPTKTSRKAAKGKAQGRRR